MHTIDIMLSNSKDTETWPHSNPIGSESIKITNIVNELSKCLFIMQHYTHSIIANYDRDKPVFELFELRLNSIVFRQQFITIDSTGPLFYEFPNFVSNDELKQKTIKLKTDNSEKKKYRTTKVPKSDHEMSSYETKLHKKASTPAIPWYQQMTSNQRPLTAKIIFDSVSSYGFNQTTGF